MATFNFKVEVFGDARRFRTLSDAERFARNQCAKDGETRRVQCLMDGRNGELVAEIGAMRLNASGLTFARCRVHLSRGMNMKSFSVLLMYPDYMSDGVETFYDFVRADTPDEAVAKARKRAVKQNEMEQDQADDFAELLVLPGHKKAIR